MISWFWKMFCLLDGKILALFARFCHWFQQLTGRTNFWLARWAVTVAAFSAVLNLGYLVGILKRSKDTMDVLPVIMVLLGILKAVYVCFFDSLACEKQDGDVLGEEKSIQKRIADQRSVGSRFFFFCFTCVIIPGLVMEVADLLEFAKNIFCPALLIYLYLIAVDPLPPSTSKRGEWLKGFFTKSKPAEADSGA